MLKKGLNTLAFHLWNSCVYMQTTDQVYVIGTLVAAVEEHNSSKESAENLCLFLYNSLTGLTFLSSTSAGGTVVSFQKLTAKEENKVAGQKPKEIKTVANMVPVIVAKMEELNEKTGKKHRGVIIMQDFPDFSFPEDWYYMKHTIDMHDKWNSCFMILSNRRNIPPFMERYCTFMHLAEVIDYNANRVEKWMKAINDASNTMFKLKPTDIPFQLPDRIKGMTTYEQSSIQKMLNACKSGSKDDGIKMIDYLTKIPSAQLAMANHVRIVMDNCMTFNHLGGLEKLKADMNESALIFINRHSENVIKHNVPIPKSIILQGVQGGGKTATAMAIANEFKAKFVIFNMADIFSGRLGDTEANIQSALNSFHELAPVVVLVDECDKSMVGIESSGRSDGGTTARAIQTYLTYLQTDHGKDGVYLVHTANELDKLPPEFMRRGRHDNIYFVDVPTTQARADIFRIHMRKLNTPEETIDNIMKNSEILTRSEQFTGAEIEEAVKVAKRKAFIADPETCEITEELLLNALSDTKAICNVDPKKIESIRQWGMANAVAASWKEGESTARAHSKSRTKTTFAKP